MKRQPPFSRGDDPLRLELLETLEQEVGDAHGLWRSKTAELKWLQASAAPVSASNCVVCGLECIATEPSTLVGQKQERPSKTADRTDCEDQSE